MNPLTDEEKEKAKSFFCKCIDQFDTFTTERWIEETIKLVCKTKSALMALPQPPRSIGKSKREDTDPNAPRCACNKRKDTDDTKDSERIAHTAPTVTVIDSLDYGTELGCPHEAPTPSWASNISNPPDDDRPQWAYGY
jgi:hypothetical protein